jgi:hypothetical protein
LSLRQTITIEVVLEVDAITASSLQGQPGWFSGDGDYEPPMSGLAIRSELVAWSLARLGLDLMGDSLKAHIVTVNADISDPISETIFEF